MKKVALATALVLSSAFALSAYAQEKSRPEVKAETASAVKAGTIPKGEAAMQAPTPTKKQTPEEAAAARAKRKSETATAVKAGEVEKGAGTIDKTPPPKQQTKAEADAARAKRKAETAAAAKAGEIPKGEVNK
jgi:Domain of unknown function (DUF4148)